MTLEEIMHQLESIEPRQQEEDPADYAQRVWESLPRVLYADLPTCLQEKADRALHVDDAKIYVHELYPLGTFADIVKDDKAFTEKIIAALHAARWTLTGTPSDDDVPIAVSLYADAFMEAWEAVMQLNPVEISNGLLTSRFLPMVTGTANALFSELSVKYVKYDKRTKKAEFDTGHGKLIITDFDKLQGALSTSAKKIMDTGLLYLTKHNFYRGNSVNPTVEIPLTEYGEANGYHVIPGKMATPEEQAAEDKRVASRLKDLKKSIRRDLDDLQAIGATFTETRGANRGDYANMRIISSHSIRRGLIRINFDIDAARYFIKANMTQFPTALLLHDNHRPNSYAIGRKISAHNAMDNNWIMGTDSTLSVKTLLKVAPEIPTIADLEKRKARNWKDKIKKPLEVALDDNVAVGYLSRWEYRDPATGTTYSKETAQALTWAQYERLVIDFVVINPPDQTARRAARLAAKQERAAQAGTPPKKRGRPRKKGVTEEQKGGDRGTKGG